MFDSFINPDAANQLKKTAELWRNITFPFSESHFHDDHMRGNQAFVPGAMIISTGWIKNQIKITEPEEQSWARKNISARIQNAKVTSQFNIACAIQ